VSAVDSREWTVETVAAVGSALASPDDTLRCELVSTALAEGIADVLDDALLMTVVGKRVLDSPDALAALPDVAAFRAAAAAELGGLPTSVRDRAAGLWGTRTLFDEAIAGRTYRLTRRIAGLNATFAATSMFRHDIGVYPAGGGGAGIVVPEIRRLNQGSSHGDLRFKAMSHDRLDDGPTAAGEILWGTYLAEADLFALAERIGSEASACATGERKVIILNGRAAMLLDRADAFADGAAADFARGLVHEAWTTVPAVATRNVQRRLARLSGHPMDGRILAFMDQMLDECGLHG
jgi:hypothetical protein